MKVVLYARVSTVGKGQDSDNQVRELKRFVTAKKSEGWKLVGLYVDQASGKNGNRPEFQQLFADAAEKRFDLVLFWSLDRFSREGVLETLQYLQNLTHHGVEWWSLKEQYLRSVGPFRDAVLAILAAIAKQERVRIQERVRAGLSRARENGAVLGRPRKLVDRDKITIMRKQGLSIRQVAKAMTVSPMTVQRILHGHQ